MKMKTYVLLNLYILLVLRQLLLSIQMDYSFSRNVFYEK